MTTRLFLGVDIGTTVVKATVINETGRIIAERLKNHNGLHPKLGWHEHDPSIHWWGAFVELTKSLATDIGDFADNISAIAISGIFPTFCPANENGEPLTNAILYDDSRSSEIAYSIREDLGPILYGNELIPRIIWLQQNLPEIWSSTKMIFWAHSYVVYKLTGVYCVDSHNAYVAGGIFDDTTFDWNTGKLSKYGISSDLLPKVNPPAKVAGYLNPKVAIELGLKNGIPVITGTGDTLLSILGSGAYKKGDVLLNYGSVGVMVRLTQDIQHLLDKGVYLNGDSGIENLLILSKYGKQIEALGALLQGAYFTKKEVDLSILDNLASEVPLAKDNIIFRRYLPTQGADLVMTLNPLADLVGFKMETTPGEIYRSALECFGFEVRRAIEKLESRPTYLCANGGGARSHVWTKIVSNIVNLPQYFSQESTGAYGNALLAGYATKGLDLDIVMQNFLNASDIIESDRSSLEIYDHLYQRYIA